MNELPHDEKSLEDVIRKIMEMTGDGKPVVIGMKIVIGGPPGGAGPMVRGGATEPEIELHHIGDRIVLSTELPGFSADKVQVLFKEDRVYIWAKDPDRNFRASRQVPPATKGSVEISLRHGVLEVSYLPAPEVAQSA